tara:strand:- start:3573 stop:3854 length:282 start_codon:yes stop_codon:yes gene_type:complete
MQVAMVLFFSPGSMVRKVVLEGSSSSILGRQWIFVFSSVRIKRLENFNSPSTAVKSADAFSEKIIGFTRVGFTEPKIRIKKSKGRGNLPLRLE